MAATNSSAGSSQQNHDTKKNNVTKNSTKKNSTQQLKLRPIWAVIGVLILVIGAVFTGKAMIDAGSKEEPEAAIHIVNKGGEVQSVQETMAPDKVTVKINLNSSAMLVGTRFQVSATVTPSNTEKTIVWKSSDEKVFSVDTDGIVTMNAVGTAALTATIGDVSDAIALECLADSNAKSQMNLPLYNREGTTAADNNTGSNNVGNTEPTVSDTGDSSGTTQPAETQTTVPAITILPSVAPTEAATSSGLVSTQIGNALEQLGFERQNDSVYVYGEGSSYHGEIVIQPNVTIIYLKDHAADFDSAVQNVLAQLLPDESAQVWSSYQSAGANKTFTVEGRRVRIVAAANGGHSQIVVYN